MTCFRRPWLFVALTCSLSHIVCAPEPGDTERFAVEQQTVKVVCGGDDTVIGIDISQYQATIDWDALADSGDAEFAFIRVGNGLGTDTQFARNWPEARRVGVRRGAYQYFRPDMDILAEARHYLAVIDAAGGYLDDDLPPMIDVEATDDQSSETIVAAVRTWVDYVEEQTGMRPVIYTGSYFWDDNVGSDAFSDYHLWTPHYTSNPCPLMSNSWERWTIWQYTSEGSITGIDGNVDTNRFNGTLEDLDRWPECSRFNPISDCPADVGADDAGLEAVLDRSDADMGSSREEADLTGGDVGLPREDAELQREDIDWEQEDADEDSPRTPSQTIERFAAAPEGLSDGCVVARPKEARGYAWPFALVIGVVVARRASRAVRRGAG
jgi:GH25 family lysozyme M1 (1,4-beta-N-acetylmuramidase)